MKKTDPKEIESLLAEIKTEDSRSESDRYLMSPDGSIHGVTESVVYRNSSNGYSVLNFNSEGSILSAVGIMPDVSEGDKLALFGKWEMNAKFGRQFHVDEYRVELPGSAADIEKYLSSGAIKGIGPKTAARIVEAFGDETADVIENHPDYLSQIQGITPKRAREISEEFKAKADIRTVMSFFKSYFGPSLTMKIYDKFGEKSVDLAKTSPFRLCDEIDGVSFDAADQMAKKLGFPSESPDRISAGLRWVLNKTAFREGHTCLPENVLINQASLTLKVPKQTVADAVESELKSRSLIAERVNLSSDGRVNSLTDAEKAGFDSLPGEENGKAGAVTRLIYPCEMYDHEKYIAGKLMRLSRGSVSLDFGEIERFIRFSEQRNGIAYAEEQRRAIFTALTKGVLVLTGGPGTGKTTVIDGLICIFENMKLKYTLAAPTGRAAKRITESTGREAKTLHRLLEVDFSDGDVGDDRDILKKFKRNEKNRLEEDVIIIDEVSMIDTLLMSALMHAVKPGCKLILIGDADQLPSVGPGNVLRDIIASGAVTTVALTKIFRQAESSLIVTNAHAINRGEMPVLNARDRDFFFMPKENDAETAALTADLVARRLPAAYGSEESVQVITPSRRGQTGTELLNKRVQELLNPPSKMKREYKHGGVLFRVGDRVMQIRNNYEIEWTTGARSGQGLFNGEIGLIEEIDAPGRFMGINFDGKNVIYDFGSLEDLEPAFAITVHKSQGSEYDTVVIPLGDVPPQLATRNLLYTAVTRAHKRVIVLGRTDVLARMVSNEKHITRFTGLSRRMAEAKSNEKINAKINF
ncbi:MAG: ATP-dependent RecD-like DNA helicase [Clostridia bacterium]|nr:ATP-dependent RecD-like DNA helicase [Clostridia bacterium]